MATETFDRVSPRKLGSSWGLVLLSGILFVGIGIVALMQPLVTGVAVGIVLGVALMSAGAVAIAVGSVNIREKGGWLYVIIGLLGFLLGAQTLFSPVAGALSLVWLMGVWLLVGGVMEVAAGFKTRKGRLSLTLLGVFNILLGGLLIVINPATALTYLAIIIGVSFLFRGIGSIVFAMGLRRLSKR